MQGDRSISVVSSERIKSNIYILVINRRIIKQRIKLRNIVLEKIIFGSFLYWKIDYVNDFRRNFYQST